MVAVVLAAGAGRRFGGTKQLSEVGGLPLVAHAVAAARAGGVAEVVVVVGHDADAVAAAARRGGTVQVVVNPHHLAGQSTSLTAGIAAAQRLDAEVAVVLLADQPGVAGAAVHAVTEAVLAGAPAARARYDDGWGHPIAFARAVWPRLEEVTGDRGARELLRALDTAEVRVPGPVPGDVDTRDDLPT